MSSLIPRYKRGGFILLMAAILITAATLFAQDKGELVQKSLPILNAKVRSIDQDNYPAFLNYAVRVLKPDWIKTDDDLSSLLKERESLIKMINGSEPLCDFLGNVAGIGPSDEWEKYDHEFGKIGIRTVFAEGMLAGFAEGPILEETVRRVASEPYRLYIKLVEAYAKSYGSEYTYMDLEPEMEAIEIAEELIARFPESKYSDAAKQILYKALFPLTDWHVLLPDDLTLVERSNYHPFCIVGNLDKNTYPCWTDIGEPKKFLEYYPSSRFHNIVARIVEEPSEIRGSKSVHLVIVDESPDEETARNAILNYLLNGIDIPHLIKLESYVVVYRFFSDPEKARRALERIKKTKPGASIREVYPQNY
ncbi:MAG: hypothetical protein A2W03_02400 [Candidatus Aminicenantes bacterium RBG_16_63_16]|nr:MAG: hypothetical protein A2W03_02400 [Candidatus Aminicenantes bacterium RBG_16_63_16]HCS49939.1 hypothetical protein [Candidatus Aminicenantes bacterium]